MLSDAADADAHSRYSEFVEHSHFAAAQTVLLDAADAEAISADLAAADAGSDSKKTLSEADCAKRRHVTLMDWGSQPVVEITVRNLNFQHLSTSIR